MFKTFPTWLMWVTLAAVVLLIAIAAGWIKNPFSSATATNTTTTGSPATTTTTK